MFCSMILFREFDRADHACTFEVFFGAKLEDRLKCVPACIPFEGWAARVPGGAAIERGNVLGDDTAGPQVKRVDHMLDCLLGF